MCYSFVYLPVALSYKFCIKYIKHCPSPSYQSELTDAGAWKIKLWIYRQSQRHCITARPPEAAHQKVLTDFLAKFSFLRKSLCIFLDRQTVYPGRCTCVFEMSAAREYFSGHMDGEILRSTDYNLYCF